ncbi:MAG: nitroreductase family deazaflavin-dependent oxidoreductase [Acidimicrobiales bacterium]|jgi:deazaflavin-dependent oxidoreductase (nitroreductase family)|nr:nitroreductase family deazaflavin-dependent oxidoreductase [Acidimicrobiales bacterium]MCS5672115.1 nitroreductase family deazaflavin-dependent oxidoreductase [Acidimicrobiales bacterium]|tara:strand:- start:230 stop:751 length:522 start_codon:yes stop_codon:yes gene_type:complete
MTNESSQESSQKGLSQKVEMEWETPSHDQIIEISRGHVMGMEMSDDDAVWCVAGMHHVLLHTIGRRSGDEHKVALPFWRDADGHRIVVGSFAGSTSDPSWVLNLRNREANPRVKVRIQGGMFWSEHVVLDGGPERDALWAALLEDRAWYADYQAKTDRVIPLVRLAETEAITD